MKLPKKQCASCPFRPDGLKLSGEKISEIYTYLFTGANHLCHSDRSGETICYGGREWQREIFYKFGVIKQPTNEALADAMQNLGIEPKEHINRRKS